MTRQLTKKVPITSIAIFFALCLFSINALAFDDAFVEKPAPDSDECHNFAQEVAQGEGLEEIGIGGYTYFEVLACPTSVRKILDEYKRTHDTREVFNENSPEFLESYGKLMINGALRCTGNIVAHGEKSAAQIVTTAAHCFQEGEAEHAEIYIQFKKRDGTVVQRKLTPYIISHEDDFAIMKLDREIPRSLIKPLLIADYPFDDIYITENNNINPYAVTCAGFSSDEFKGDKGRHLTYDQQCDFVGGQDGWKANTNCIVYPGASGGALVVTVTDRENNNKVTDYFVGINHAGSFNPLAEKRPQLAVFIEHSAMYEDLLNALGEELPLVSDDTNDEESSENQ